VEVVVVREALLLALLKLVQMVVLVVLELTLLPLELQQLTKVQVVFQAQPLMVALLVVVVRVQAQHKLQPQQVVRVVLV
jgi:hypothetical protein